MLRVVVLRVLFVDMRLPCIQALICIALLFLRWLMQIN